MAVDSAIQSLGADPAVRRRPPAVGRHVAISSEHKRARTAVRNLSRAESDSHRLAELSAQAEVHRLYIRISVV